MIAAVVPNLDKKDTDRCTRALVKKLHSLGADVWMAETMRPYFGDTGVGFLKDEKAQFYKSRQSGRPGHSSGCGKTPPLCTDNNLPQPPTMHRVQPWEDQEAEV